jgi:phytoene synthase
LPREALALANINTSDPSAVASSRHLAPACNFIVDRARAHFKKADEIMARCPRQVVRAPRIMGAVYRQKLEDMVSRGWTPPRNRLHVKKSYLLWIALRHAFV